MSMYGNADKDYLYDDLYGYINDDGLSVYDVLDVINDIIRDREARLKADIRKELEEEYKGYKEKYESMKKFMGEL